MLQNDSEDAKNICNGSCWINAKLHLKCSIFQFYRLKWKLGIIELCKTIIALLQK